MNKEQQTMAAYEAPMIEVIEVEVEKGFATSNAGISGVGVTDWNENGLGNFEAVEI